MEEIFQKLGIPKMPFVIDENRTLDYATVSAKLGRLTGIKLHFDVGTSLHPLDRFKNIISISARKNLAQMHQYAKPILGASRSLT